MKKILENLKKDTSGKWVNINDVESLVEQLIAGSIDAVQNTGKQCAYTTHDLGMVECTINQCTESLKTYFGVQ